VSSGSHPFSSSNGGPSKPWTADDHCCAIYILSIIIAVGGGWGFFLAYGVNDGSWDNPHLRPHTLMGLYFIYLLVVLMVTIIPTRLARADLIESKVRYLKIF
jgi:hypothetical protein